MDPVYENKIFYTPSGGNSGATLDLTLEGEFAFHAGLEPQTWTFKVSYLEFDKLNLKYDRHGTLQFKFSPGATFEYSILNVTLADVEGLTIGTPVGDAKARHIEYRLIFTDFRETFVAPRGGTLELGVKNTKDLSDDDCKPNS